LTANNRMNDLPMNLGPHGEPGLIPPGSGFGHTPGFLFFFAEERRVSDCQDLYRDLIRIAKRHETFELILEKTVDVMLAVAMVMMAEREEIDAAT